MDNKAKTLLNKLSTTEKNSLKNWAYIDSKNTIAWGNVGQNISDMVKSEREWNTLSKRTKSVYNRLLKAHQIYKNKALKECSKETNLKECEISPQSALGDGYLLNPYISVRDF